MQMPAIARLIVSTNHASLLPAELLAVDNNEHRSCVRSSVCTASHQHPICRHGVVL
jgi:hypothetical protein